MQASLPWKRSYFVLGLSMFAVFGSVYFGFPGSGGLCTLVLAFIAGVGWSDEKVNVYTHHTKTPLNAQLSRSLDFRQEWQMPICVDSCEY